jgi:hypothetical protein
MRRLIGFAGVAVFARWCFRLVKAGVSATAHMKYGSYVLRHKWFVGRQARQMGLSWWQALTHDWSKFLSNEWIPYVRYFYGDVKRKPGAGKTGYLHQPGDDDAFDYAWLSHQHRQSHHWQHWCLRRDTGEYIALPMPERYIREMVADWYGAGMAQGASDIWAWYTMNSEKIVLHPQTRFRLEQLLHEYFPRGHRGGLRSARPSRRSAT